MKRLIVLILLAALLGGVSIFMTDAEPGYIYIAWFGYSLEMKIWPFLLSLFLLLSVVALLFKGVVWLVSAPLRLSRWIFGVDESKLQSQTAHALAAYEEGHWQRARKALVKIAQRSQNPLVFYLMAARASHQLGESDKVDEFLAAATKASPSGAMAISLTQAQLQLVDGALENCLATLIRAQAIDEEHPKVVQMLAEVYEGLSDWPSLYALLPQLKKLGIDDTRSTHFAAVSAQGLLKAAAEDSIDALSRQWRQLSALTRGLETVLVTYAEQLGHLGEVTQAIKPLKDYLREKPSDAPVLLQFAAIAAQENAGDGLRFLGQIENAADSMALRLAQAKLAAANGLSGQYQAYLDQALTAPQTGNTDWVQRQLLLELLAAGASHDGTAKALEKLSALAQEIADRG